MSPAHQPMAPMRPPPQAVMRCPFVNNIPTQGLQFSLVFAAHVFPPQPPPELEVVEAPKIKKGKKGKRTKKTKKG